MVRAHGELIILAAGDFNLRFWRSCSGVRRAVAGNFDDFIGGGRGRVAEVQFERFAAGGVRGGRRDGAAAVAEGEAEG